MTLRGLLWITLALPALVWNTGETHAADALPPEPLHPAVVLLDANAEPVVQSHNPVSTMRTCAACHDTQYIEGHSYHASLGMDRRSAVGTIPGAKPWDYSFGGVGRWNPLTYRYLTPPGDRQLDLGVADWIRHSGWRHVGGGIAERGFAQGPLPNQEQAGGAGAGVDSDNQVLDAETGLPRAWDWDASGRVEMNCFLCHCERPDNDARIEELQEGGFRWAATATLQQTGIVAKANARWEYQRGSFAEDGSVSARQLGLREPTARHCGQCHGVVHEGQSPLSLDLSVYQWSTATKVQVFSAQRMLDSAVNLKDKSELARPWDVHAESMLDCKSCHFSLNNPAKFESIPRNRPSHLLFEPRWLSLGEYLQRPSHQFAKGQTVQGSVAQHLAGTMRRCDDCHDAENTHDWLPYRAVHLDRLSCEACHIPQTHAPAISQLDWTMIDSRERPQTQWRGMETDTAGKTIIAGFQPVLLPRENLDGGTRLVPCNLITASYWVAGVDLPRPVREVDLRRAFLAPGGYHPQLVAAMDTDGSGNLDENELRLDTAKKTSAAASRLSALGLIEPRIVSEIQPYELHHGVGPASGATGECVTCHARDSRLGQPITLAAYLPGDVRVETLGGPDLTLAGTIAKNRDGVARFHPRTRESDLYVLGHDNWPWVNIGGVLAILGVLLGSGVHAAMRIRHGQWLTTPEHKGRKDGEA